MMDDANVGIKVERGVAREENLQVGQNRRRHGGST